MAQTIPEVALAGFAFAGSQDAIADRFKFSLRYEAALKAEGTTAFKKLSAATSALPPSHLKLVGRIDELTGHDQVLAVSLVVNAETVSVETFGNLQKLFIQIRAQALFFDFKSMTVLRAYPLSFAYLDVFDHAPSDEEILQRLRLVYEGTQGKQGVFGRFAQALQTASVPAQAPRLIQVSHVSLAPEVLALIPAYMQSKPQEVQSWVADMLSEALSSRVGVPMVPYAKGYAMGNVMSMSVSDGNVFNLKLPTPDYEVSVDVTALKKIKYSQVDAGASFVYGVYTAVKIDEPLGGHHYLNTALKNGEVKVVPATQTQVDDFPAYVDSLKGTFNKLADAIAGNGNAWIKGAAAAHDIDGQIAQTKDLMTLCK